MRSPFIAITAYEQKLGLPVNYINCSMCVQYPEDREYVSVDCLRFFRRTGRGSNGAWQRFERGEMDLLPFYEAFGRDLSDTVNGNLWSVPSRSTVYSN